MCLRIVRDHPGRPILLLVDTQGQRLSRRDELLGINGYMAHLAKCLQLARNRGHKIIGLVYSEAVSGGFLASSLLADRCYALPEAQVRVMNLPAMSRITKIPLERLEELSKSSPVFAPGVTELSQDGRGLFAVGRRSGAASGRGAGRSAPRATAAANGAKSATAANWRARSPKGCAMRPAELYRRHDWVYLPDDWRRRLARRSPPRMKRRWRAGARKDGPLVVARRQEGDAPDLLRLGLALPGKRRVGLVLPTEAVGAAPPAALFARRRRNMARRFWPEAMRELGGDHRQDRAEIRACSARSPGSFSPPTRPRFT